MTRAINIGNVLVFVAVVGAIVDFNPLGGDVQAQATPLMVPTVQAPITLARSIGFGSGVNKKTGGNICTANSRGECRSGALSSEAGGFMYPNSVAADLSTGNLYVADSGNSRIQELTASGAFLAMFGRDVNATEDRQAGASPEERDVCTAASRDVCKAGVSGAGAGQLSYPGSIAVAPDTGDVYVLEVSPGDFRIDKYTSGGRFSWRIGKSVNATTKGNLCTAREVERSHVTCGAGSENSSESYEPGAFKFAQTYGDLLAVGGPEDLLYVGDEHRVQEFEADGKWKREILLSSLSSGQSSNVAALALDAGGDLYLVYHVLASASNGNEEQANVIHRFNPNGEQVAEFSVTPRQAKTTVGVNGLALDASDRLAVIGNELGVGSVTRFGSLYEASTGRHIADFTGPSDNDGISFNSDGDLYVAATDDQEVVGYVPAPLAELVMSPAPCEIGLPPDSAATFECALSAS